MSKAGLDPLSRLTIPPEKKRARPGAGWVPLALVLLVILILALAWFWLGRPPRVVAHSALPPSPSATSSNPASAAMLHAPPAPGQVLLTAPGYIVPRERIEVSAKFPGTVSSIRVKKGDQVKKGDVLATLVDDEYRSKAKEAHGRLALAEAKRTYAEATYQRQLGLTRSHAATDQALDDSRRDLDMAKAELLMAQGELELAQTKLAWCTIHAPIDGTVLEKLVDENELVIPQGFGFPGTPSTTLLTIANLNELQVEVDVTELDTPKVRLQQLCRVAPEAYPDKTYPGHVAEIAPAASRQKGTLQVKVQIQNPDRFLTPELNAKVHFLAP